MVNQNMIQNIVKGTRVQARWFDARLTALAGVQMKMEAKEHNVIGIVTHIYGNHPTNPTKFEIIVKPDDDSEEISIKPEHIIVINVGQPDEKKICVNGVSSL